MAGKWFCRTIRTLGTIGTLGTGGGFRRRPNGPKSPVFSPAFFIGPEAGGATPAFSVRTCPFAPFDSEEPYALIAFVRVCEGVGPRGPTLLGT